MRRLLTTLGVLAALLFPAMAISGQAAAVNIFKNTCDSAAKDTSVCESVNEQEKHNDQNPIIEILKAAINVISYIVGIAAVIGIIVSGLRMITAGGDSNAVASARSGLVYSLIGIAVVALAQTIVVFVLDKVK